MSSFPVRDVTALNITNAALGLAVLAILVVVAIQALGELRLYWRHHAGHSSHPATTKRGWHSAPIPRSPS